jgi:uncharacterized membrane protein YvlD (DUF360 family)
VIGFYAMIAVLVLIAAAVIHGVVDAAGFWGALIMAAVFAVLLITVYENAS